MRACSVTQSHLNLCGPMNCSHQWSLSMEFSRYKYWNVLPFPSLGYVHIYIFFFFNIYFFFY